MIPCHKSINDPTVTTSGAGTTASSSFEQQQQQQQQLLRWPMHWGYCTVLHSRPLTAHGASMQRPQRTPGGRASERARRAAAQNWRSGASAFRRFIFVEEARPLCQQPSSPVVKFHGQSNRKYEPNTRIVCQRRATGYNHLRSTRY